MIDSSPKRIASLLSSATEILYALGLGDRVVAVSHECDYPPEATSKPRATLCRIDAAASSGAIDDEVRRRIAAGQPLYEVDCELLARLRPDLIVTQAQCDVCAVRYEDVLEAIRSVPELRATRIVALNPRSLEDAFADIRRVGEAAGCGERAEAYVASLRRRVAQVCERTKNLTAEQRPRVACIEWIEPLMLAGNWMPELLDLAGAAPSLATGREHSRCWSWEDLVAYQPDVIIVMPCGFDAGRAAAEVSELTRKPGWSELPAVRDGRIWAADGNAYFNRAGPRLVESLELLAHLAHPQRFVQTELPAELSSGSAVICLTGAAE